MFEVKSVEHVNFFNFYDEKFNAYPKRALNKVNFCCCPILSKREDVLLYIIDMCN